MVAELVPILRVSDGHSSALWYRRLGFEVIGEHRFAPTLPLYLFLRRGMVHLHLSEHAGDAPPAGVVYLYADDLDAIAVEFAAPVSRQPWGREIELVDPDGNRWRIGEVADVAPTWRGLVEAVHIADGAKMAMRSCEAATLLAGIGVEGDRYATRAGTYSDRHHIDRQVTLIEAEVLEALRRDRGIELAPHEHRRNITTRGVPLSQLVGQYFRVGACVLFGGRLNVPCKHLDEVVGRPVFRQLINRSGLNARVIVGGAIGAGAIVEPVDAGDLDPHLVADNEQHALVAPPDVQ